VASESLLFRFFFLFLSLLLLFWELLTCKLHLGSLGYGWYSVNGVSYR
jgi:hypothetical protein